MKAFDLLGIEIQENKDHEDMLILSTDEKTVGWISEQIHNLCPSAQQYMNLNLESRNLPQTKNLWLAIKKMGFRQRAIGLWLVQQLCHQGWEPFGNTGFRMYHFESLNDFGQITLRRECEIP